MKLWSKIKVMLCSLLLTGCFAPALLMTSQAQLLGELFRPLVGFNPLDVNLFENPLIRDPMVALMGEDILKVSSELGKGTTFEFNTTLKKMPNAPVYTLKAPYTIFYDVTQQSVYTQKILNALKLVISGNDLEIRYKRLNSTDFNSETVKNFYKLLLI